MTDDSYHALPAQDIGDQLTKARVSWRAYMEGLGSDGCLNSPVPYDPGHNPFAYYGGRCPANVVPLTSLAADLTGNTPLFSWITPDMCHDEHSCNVSVGDDWLRQTVGTITQSKAWTANGVLFIVWDEDTAAPATACCHWWSRRIRVIASATSLTRTTRSWRPSKTCSALAASDRHPGRRL